MTAEELQQIAIEVRANLSGRKFGRLFPLGPTAFAVDFHPHSGSYLFIDYSRRHRSVYLIVRKLKVLERQATNPTPFQLRLRQALSGYDLIGVDVEERGIALNFVDLEGRHLRMLVAVNPGQPNVLLLDEGGAMVTAARSESDDLSLPKLSDAVAERTASSVEDLSAYLDRNRLEADEAEKFQRAATAARRLIAREIGKRRKLLQNLDGDLDKHGNAAQWKRFGDLLLASLQNLKKEGDSYRLHDLFDPEMPEILIPAISDDGPPIVAEKYFKLYRKAANAVDAIAERKRSVATELERIQGEQVVIETAIENRDIEALRRFLTPVEQILEKPAKTKKEPEIKGVRRFASSNGFEILVGKKSVDNDKLTFRISRSLDTWLHAADYPGSHVVIRNPNRKGIPPQTLIEAASLAAFYSDAREMPKAAVNYTLRKFVNKPKRAAPGLVSLSSFKTLVVKPEVPSTVTNLAT